MNVGLGRAIKATKAVKAVKEVGKEGSYITEAAISLPVLIICVCAMILIVRIAAVCENIWFAEAEEIRDTGLRAYKKITDVSLCERIEEKVLSSEESLTDFRVRSCRYLYSKAGIDDLISAEARAVFRVVNVLGIDGEIVFETKIMARGFTGTLRKAEPLPEALFKESGSYREVTVFPRYGIRFHSNKCRYVKIYDNKGSYKLVMDKRDAEMKGYTPCSACGGAADG